MNIRPAREEDLPVMLEIYRPYVEETTTSFEYETPSLEEFRSRFREHVNEFPWLVWEEDGQVLGYAYAGLAYTRAAYRWCAEISIYFRRDARGRGRGRKLLAVLEEILTQQGYRVSYAIITAENEASLRFHEAMGYRTVAELPNCGYKMGRWLGIRYLQKDLNPLGAPEAFPVSWRELEGRA